MAEFSDIEQTLRDARAALLTTDKLWVTDGIEISFPYPHPHSKRRVRGHPMRRVDHSDTIAAIDKALNDIARHEPAVLGWICDIP